MYKPDLALNNLQWSICHQAKRNQTKPKQIKPKSFSMMINIKPQVFLYSNHLNFFYIKVSSTLQNSFYSIFYNIS